jgi:hypothetical protein
MELATLIRTAKEAHIKSISSRYRDAFLPRPKPTRPIYFLRKVSDKGAQFFLDVYDNVGSNGIFGANPSVVKFAGFETLKTHTLKVRLINNSPAP